MTDDTTDVEPTVLTPLDCDETHTVECDRTTPPGHGVAVFEIDVESLFGHIESGPERAHLAEQYADRLKATYETLDPTDEPLVLPTEVEFRFETPPDDA